MKRVSKDTKIKRYYKYDRDFSWKF